MEGPQGIDAIETLTMNCTGNSTWHNIFTPVSDTLFVWRLPVFWDTVKISSRFKEFRLITDLNRFCILNSGQLTIKQEFAKKSFVSDSLN